MAEAKTFELYRYSSLGVALQKSLGELVEDGVLDSDQALACLGDFDHEFSRLVADAGDGGVSQQFVIGGKLDNYNHVDEVWKMTLNEVTLKHGKTKKAAPSFRVDAKRVRLIAMDGRPPRKRRAQ